VADLNLTIALERYDRHVPLFMGLVKMPAGLSLRPLEIGMAPQRRDGNNRHARFLRGREFDVAETSLSSHIIATSRGEPFVGVPVFPRRLFSQNHFFVNKASGIEEPRDLIGRRVLIRSFQTTMSVLALGDLKFEYGVPWESIHWLVETDEVLPLAERKGVKVERVGPKADVGRLLIDGHADAMIYPHPPHAVLEARDKVRMLFPDRKAEAVRYYRKHGYYPIMHLIAVQKPLIEAHPWLARALMDVWNDARAISREFYDDPGYAQLAFARNEFEAQAETMAAEIWPSGVKANRANLERFIRYSLDQQLIERTVAVDDLFHPSVLDS
jgi:4,5-dihydroxyphthalate decarboxylase